MYGNLNLSNQLFNKIQITMKKQDYFSPVLRECNVRIERGFSVSLEIPTEDNEQSWTN